MRRSLKKTLRYRTALLLFSAGLCLPVLPVGFAAEKVPLPQAEQRIQTHINEIDRRFGAMNSRYYSGPSESTLAEAFRQEEVQWAMRYTQAWGGWLWTSWHHTEKFYQIHRNNLEASLDAVRQQGYGTEADLNYLDQGMNAWKNTESEIEKVFEEQVKAYGRSAKKQDEIHQKRKELEEAGEYAPNKTPAQESRVRRLQAELKELEQQNASISGQIDQLRDAKLSPLRDRVLFSALQAKERIQITPIPMQIQTPLEMPLSEGTAEEPDTCEDVERPEIPNLLAKFEELKAQSDAKLPGGDTCPDESGTP